MTTKEHQRHSPLNPGTGAPASNTYPLSSHIALPSPQSPATINTSIPPVVAVDCLHMGGTGRWDHKRLQLLDAVHQTAKEQGSPVSWKMTDRTVLVHPKGMRVGSNIWLKYRIEFAGIQIGISDRHSSGRRNPNYQLQAPGESCLRVGLPGIIDFQDSVVHELGGELADSWLRRVDFCLDLPGVSIHDYLLPAYNQEHFVTTAARWSAYAGPRGSTGFSFCSEGLTLNVYDKLAEVQHKGEDYKQEMLQYRWGGKWPTAATRVEFQTRKPWLGTDSIHSSADLMARLGNIVSRLTNAHSRQFVRFTTSLPDRNNGNQGRALTHPHWAEVNQAFQVGFPQVVMPLSPLQRDSITGSQLLKIAVGCISKAAAMQGVQIHSAEDAIAFLSRKSPNDARWKQSWLTHAVKLGLTSVDLQDDT